MNKKEAASYLGVSERAIERYTAKGRLAPSYDETIRPGHRVAIYDQKQLDRAKEEMAAPQVRPILTRDQPDKPDTPQALARRGVGIADLFAVIAQAVKEGRGNQAAPVPTLSLSDKMTLSLSEASHLSGLSRGYLQQAIKAGKLKAKIIGRGWRVKRADLDQYVTKL